MGLKSWPPIRVADVHDVNAKQLWKYSGGTGRAGRTGEASCRACFTAAAPGVVLRVADGIVRILLHVVAAEDLGGRPRRRIDFLIGVAAGERQRHDREDDAERRSPFATRGKWASRTLFGGAQEI